MIGDKKEHKEEPAQHYPVISGPTDVKREMHIGFNPQTGKFEVWYYFLIDLTANRAIYFVSFCYLTWSTALRSNLLLHLCTIYLPLS